MSKPVREYFVTLTVELAGGEPRDADEYGWSKGARIRPTEFMEGDWWGKNFGNALSMQLLDVQVIEKNRTRGFWRRLFRG